MPLELSKNAAKEVLDFAKKHKDYARSQMQRDLTEARNYYRSYELALKRAAKHEQEMLDWDKTVEDLKAYEPDREMPGDLDELIANLRVIVSKNRDVDEEGN